MKLIRFLVVFNSGMVTINIHEMHGATPYSSNYFRIEETAPLLYTWRWVGSLEDPDFAKQNDWDSAASHPTDITAKLLKQGINVPIRQAAAYVA